MILKQEKTLKHLVYLYREIDYLYHEIARKIGLSDSAFLIFYSILELGEGCQQKDLCELLSTSKQTTHSSIRKLERDGYIRMCQDGGREKRIYLTEKGRAFAEEKILPVAQMENEVFIEMSQEDCEELIRLTRQYLVRFSEKTKQL